MIADYLIENYETKINKYFLSDDWKNKYKDKISQIQHDEPWLTLIASYALFGNQDNYSEDRLNAINKIFSLSGLSNKINFTSIINIVLEKKLPEIIPYRKYLKESFEKENFHLYPDRRQLIDTKISDENSSFEGSTNLDLMIEGISNNKKIVCFIEAKYLSDISYQITYNPVRDQIIRNIDCGIDCIEDKKHNNPIDSYDEFHFLLLTPKIFRIPEFGGNKESEITKFQSNKGRYYCYKMKDYLNPENLKSYLPHRELTDNNWKIISENIGWLTFEDIYSCCKEFATIENNKEAEMIEQFLVERNLLK